jgi:parallel beta-helix repeat protein
MKSGFRSSRILATFLIGAATAVLLLLLAIPAAEAVNLCGTLITSSTVLDEDQECADPITIGPGGSLNLNNFTISGQPSSPPDVCVFVQEGVSDAIIRNGTVTDCVVGIELNGLKNSVTNVHVTSNDIGILAKGERHNIRACLADANRVGIRLEADESRIKECRTWNNRTGVVVTGNDNRVQSNRSWANTLDGFRVTGARNYLQANQANSNGEDGFDIRGSENPLQDNSASSNTACNYNIESAAAIDDRGGNRSNGVVVFPLPVGCTP